MQVAIQYATDAYLNEHLDIAKQTLEQYGAALNAYAKPPTDYQTMFRQGANNITNMLNRIAGNLDFFGHPAGWTPMLSFQSNLAIYTSEVKAGISELYLAYRINQDVQKTTKAIDLLTTSITQLQTEMTNAIKDFDKADSELPSINAQLEDVLAQLKNLSTSLAALEKKLLEEAKHDVEAEHMAKFFTRILGGICQMIPVGQPALGAVGSGLNIIADIDTSKPISSFDQLSTLLKDYKSKNLKDSADKTKKDQKDKDITKPEDSGINASKLIDASVNILSGLKSITTAFTQLKASDEEIQARLQEIEAANVEYKFYVEQIKNLNEMKAKFSAALSSTLQKLVNANKIINTDLLKINSMYTQRTLDISQIDHQAILFIRDMDQSARMRLIKYQYFLVKAFQYRMLQAFGKTDYQLNAIVDKFAALESNKNKDGTLSAKDYNTLASTYKTVLTNMADTILTKYEEQQIEKSIDPLVIPLTKTQLDELNNSDSKQVVINLMEMGQLELDWQEIRITKIETNYIELSDGSHAGSGTTSVLSPDPKAKPSSSPDANNVDISYECSGLSLLQSSGKVYGFNPHFNSQCMSWGSIFNIKSKGKDRLVPIVPDPVTGSLLKELLKDISTKDPSPLTDYQPGAMGDITISKNVLPLGSDAVITKLKLALSFTYRKLPDNEAVLYVKCADGLTPLISCDTTDLNGCDSGQGTFLRIYPKYQKITLTAPAEYGDNTFAQWQYPNGETITTKRSIECLLNSGLYVKCLFTKKDVAGK